MYETHDKRALLLPNVTPADAGKVLAVDENGKLSLEEIGSGLPEVSSSDAGRILTVSEDGEWEAASPSGGGLTLYGPYFATISEPDTLLKGNGVSKQLSAIYNSNNELVEAPTAQHIELYSGIYAPVCIIGFMPGLPVISPNDEVFYNPPEVNLMYPDTGESGPASITLSSENLYAMIYSDVEFTPIE